MSSSQKAHKALRGVRRTIAKQVKGRFACKFRFTVTYEYVDLQCAKLKPSNITVLWFRSHRSKTSKKPEVKACYLDPKTGLFMYNASWTPPNTVELVVTLYKDSSGNFKKKDYFFVIETHVPDAERKKLAIFSCNMAEFASPDINEFDLELEFKPQSKKVVQAKLGARIKCEFIKEGSAYDDDMESNFSHMSDSEFKQRINELTDFSDEEEDSNKDSNKKKKARQSWTKFVDEMKTLEYQEYHIAMVGNPLADSIEDKSEPTALHQGIDQNEEENVEEECLDLPPGKDTKSRVKKTRVLSALIEEEEEEPENDDINSCLSLPDENTTTPSEEIKFVFPDRKLTRAETLPDIHLASGNGIVQESHRIKEWMNDVNYKKQESVISALQLENHELREGNKVLGNEIMELHKEKDDLQAEISELQMLVEDLRTKISEMESKERKKESEKRGETNTKGDSSGTNTLSQNKKATQVRGWLCKRGVKGLTGRVWRRRWFSTDQQERLYYYKKNNNTQPRGFIDLNIIIAVQDKPSDEQDTNNALFDVIVPGRVYELMAHDEEEKMRWINALDYLRHWRSRMTNKDGVGNTSYS